MNIPASAPRTLVLGTTSRHKVREIRELWPDVAWQLHSLVDDPRALDVVEDGHTFAENAAKKSVAQARHLGAWVLAEDSGLVVDALAGAPGIYSARYSDPGATDARNNAKLLVELADVPRARRTAHYVCHAVAADPTGQVRASAEGRCHGLIRTEPSGAAGFGYDPLFELPEYHRTFGELGDAVKTVLSHRARALAAIRPQLERLISAGQW